MGEHGCCRTGTEEKGHCHSEGGCGCGHGTEHAGGHGHEQGHECQCGHEHGHEQSPLTKEEKIKMLKEYLESLEQEVKGVSEKIKELESE